MASTICDECGTTSSLNITASVLAFLESISRCARCDRDDTTLHVKVKGAIIEQYCRDCCTNTNIAAEGKLEALLEEKCSEQGIGIITLEEKEKYMSDEFEAMNYITLSNYIWRMRYKTGYSDVYRKAEQLGVIDWVPYAIMNSLFFGDPSKDLQIYNGFIRYFTKKNPKAQLNAIFGLESHGVARREILTQFDSHLRELYDYNIIEKDTIIFWHKLMSTKNLSKDNCKKVHEKSKIFVDWLRSLGEK